MRIRPGRPTAGETGWSRTTSHRQHRLVRQPPKGPNRPDVEHDYLYRIPLGSETSVRLPSSQVPPFAGPAPVTGMSAVAFVAAESPGFRNVPLSPELLPPLPLAPGNGIRSQIYVV